MKLLREEMKQNAAETKNSIIEEFQSLPTGIMNVKGKGIINKESATTGDTRKIRGRWISPTPEENMNQKQDSGSSNDSVGGVFGSIMDPEGLQKYLPTIELIAFDGKKPRVWIRKCIKYFEVYKVPNGKKVEIASSFFIHIADSSYHNWIKGRWSSLLGGL